MVMLIGLHIFLKYFVLFSTSIMSGCGQGQQDGYRKYHKRSNGLSTTQRTNYAHDNSVFERTDFNVEDALEYELLPSEKRKRFIHPNSVTNMVSMIFQGETIERIEDKSILNSTDFIIRMQEKFEYICDAYIESTPNIKNDYFRYDESLVYPEEGDRSYKDEKAIKTKETFPYRYRMLDEPCVHSNEEDFWREMFLVAENDVTKYLKTASNADVPEYYYIGQPQHEMMRRFNEVWIKFQDKGVCNQKLLLECNPTNSSCVCRRLGAGIATLSESYSHVASIPYDYEKYTDHEGSTSPVSSTESSKNGKPKVHRANRCVIKAKFKSIEGNETHPPKPLYKKNQNSCDFFLPVIGLCRVDCEADGECVGVDQETKNKFKTASREKYPHWDKRIQTYRLHSKYHNVCKCRRNTSCEQDDDESSANIQVQLPDFTILFFVIQSQSYFMLFGF